jgi:NTP pyrophosphatase (non-canonical NTP hydrolase)
MENSTHSSLALGQSCTHPRSKWTASMDSGTCLTCGAKFKRLPDGTVEIESPPTHRSALDDPNFSYDKFVNDNWFCKDARPVEGDLFITAQGLSGECGEILALFTTLTGLAAMQGMVAETLKKHVRDQTDVEEFKRKLKKELGDELCYLVRLAGKFGFTLKDVIETNVWKTEARKRLGTQHGSGDDR